MEEIEKNEYIENLEREVDSIIANGFEPNALQEIQDSIHEYDILDEEFLFGEKLKDIQSVDINSVIAQLSMIRDFNTFLLLRSFNTFKTGKYRNIYAATLNMIKWLSVNRRYESIIEQAQHVEMYIEDSIESSPDDFNTIALICDIFRYDLEAYLKLELDYSIIYEILKKYISYMILIATQNKYLCHASLIIRQTADCFKNQHLYNKACEVYENFEYVLSKIDNTDINCHNTIVDFMNHKGITFKLMEEYNKCVERHKYTNIDNGRTLYRVYAVDTFSYEIYVVGDYKSKCEAEKMLKECLECNEDDGTLNDEYWISVVSRCTK